MNTAILNDIAERYRLRRGCGRWAGPCPECGGSSRSDKFDLRDDGGFRCYACGFKGDLITWLRKMEGLSCADAHERADIVCTSTSCQVRGTCRMGDGSGRRPGLASVKPTTARQCTGVPECVPVRCGESWLSWAEDFVARCHGAIGKNAPLLAWLAGRGIDGAAVARFRLGWHRGNGKVARQRLGLPAREDGKAEVWTPAGLVIPAFDAAGRVTRVKIRRTDDDRHRFLPDLKYVLIEGSSRQAEMIMAGGRPRGAVVVEAELDGMAVAAAHDEVMVLPLGTASGGITEEQRDMLAACPVVLVALDADAMGVDGRRPGPDQYQRWALSFRHARLWPVPSGKDPGEYAAAGGSLRQWVEAGLPPPRDDLVLVPGRIEGGGGAVEISFSANEGDDAEELAGLLRASGVWICKDGGAVRLVGGKRWAADNAAGFRRIGELVFRSSLCGWLVERNPAERIGAGNLMEW